MTLDPIDLHILAELEKNGRVLNAHLAKTVGLSPSPCLARVARLERAGYIIGYGARLNLSAIGELVTVFTEITLQDRRMATISRFEQKLRTIEELSECCRIEGDCDYILKFITRSVAHYREIIMKIADESTLVDRYFTYFVVRSFDLPERRYIEYATSGMAE